MRAACKHNSEAERSWSVEKAYPRHSPEVSSSSGVPTQITAKNSGSTFTKDHSGHAAALCFFLRRKAAPRSQTGFWLDKPFWSEVVV